MDREKILEDILQYSGMDQASIDKCRETTKNSPVYQAKSDMLFRFGVMNGLMFEPFGEYLDIFMVIADHNTGENASLVHAAKAEGKENTFDYSENTIDWIVADLVAASAESSRVNNNGDKCGNEVLTSMVNAVAKVCVSRPDVMNGFNDCIKYWKDKLEKKEQQKE